jgi:hypothetical protein
MKEKIDPQLLQARWDWAASGLTICLIWQCQRFSKALMGLLCGSLPGWCGPSWQI